MLAARCLAFASFDIALTYPRYLVNCENKPGEEKEERRRMSAMRS